MPAQVAASALYLAQDKQLFAKHGLDVKLSPFLLGKFALQTVLDGQADLAIVGDTPFMLAVLRGEQIAVLATVFESRRTLAIFARKDRGISGPGTLSGKTVGTTTGTSAEYFLDTVLDVNGVPRSAVHVVGLKPEQMIDALVSGKVDAVTVRYPDLGELEQQLGAKGLTIFGEDYFIFRFLLVGKKSYIDSHPLQIARILTALDESNRLIRADPEGIRTLLGQRLQIAPSLLGRSVTPDDFTLMLDQQLLLALSAQARWAAAKPDGQGKTMPDFLDYIQAAPLTRMAPDANKMIR